jgi:polyhydroxyalkanoate synthesis repressor PhaR
MGRIIKRYGNRKLYDTRESRYITLEEIAGYVRDGEDVTVIENETGADQTSVAFAQIILEEERRKGGILSVPLLRTLIRDGEQAIRSFTEGMGRGVSAISDLGEFATRHVQSLVGLGGGEGLGNGAAKEDHKPIE